MSAPQIEREIRMLLNREGSPDAVARELINRWHKNLFDHNEQAAIAQFLITTGQKKMFLDEVARLLENRRPLPWVQLVSVLIEAGVAWKKEEVAALKEGLRDQDMIESFIQWPAIEKIDSSFKELRKKLALKGDSERDKLKEQLRDQLNFFRNQRMYDEESATLQKLKALFPDDPEFQLDQKNLSERWARDVLANYSSHATELTEELLLRAQEVRPENKSIKDALAAQALVIAEEKPHLAYDLALMFLFMEFYSDALEVLAFAPPSAQRDWLRLDLLLKARQYVTVLDEAAKLELQFSGDPESTFSVTYARARALWGLGQASMAIDLIRSIVRVRPNYRSARSLLLDWSGGEP